VLVERWAAHPPAAGFLDPSEPPWVPRAPWLAVEAVTGEQHWVFEIGVPVTSSPAVVDRVGYVASGDSKLYAPEPGVPTGSPAAASPAP